MEKLKELLTKVLGDQVAEEQVNDLSEAINEMVEEEVQGLKNKRDELLKKNRDLRNRSSDDPQELTRLQDENEQLQSQLQASQNEVKKLTKRYETDTAKLMEERDGSATALNSYVAKEQLSSALRKAGVQKDSYLSALLNMYTGQAQTERTDNGIVVKVGDKPVEEWAKEWAASPEAADFITVHNSGGGASGNGGGAGNKTIKRSDFDQMPHVERAKAVSEGATVVDD